LKAAADECLEDAIADARRVARRADDGHRPRAKEGSQGRRGGDPVARFESGDGRLARHDRQVHLDLTPAQLLREGESRLAKDVAHGPIIGVGNGPEPGKAVPHRQHRKPFQKERAEAFAVERLVYGECDFGRPFVLREV